jgi:phosphatidylglycerol---prolipoprotein diacylglyceryl transferase
MLDFTPDPIAFQLGPLPVYWYGIGYALGLAAVYLLLTRLARRAGEDPDLVGNGMIIVAVAALIGGRLYHVIDQWALYQDDLLSIVLPPYTGLGAYGGLLTGTIAVFAYTRYKGVSFWRWVDIVAPGVFLMQAIARWGNFFNQELYGPPTTLPWGIPIECVHRISAYACSEFPFETTRFHPLFLYESLSGLLGMLFLLWVGSRFRARLRPGDIAMVFFIWYGLVRFVLETLRSDNWTFFGIPTAMLVSLAFAVVALLVLVWRHRPGHPGDDPPSHPERATWGAVGAGDWTTAPIDEPWAHAGDLSGGVVKPPEEFGIGAPIEDDETPASDDATATAPTPAEAMTPEDDDPTPPAR